MARKAGHTSKTLRLNTIEEHTNNEGNRHIGQQHEGIPVA